MSPEDKIAQKRSDVEWVMSTEQGRRFIWELLGMTGMFRMQEGDADQRTIQEGARRVGLQLTGIITDVDELLFFQMQLESRNRRLEEIKNYEQSIRQSEPANTTSSPDESEYDYLTGGYDSGAFEPGTGYEFGTLADNFF